MGSCWNPDACSGGVKPLKHFGIKIEETCRLNLFWMQVQCQYALK